MAQAQEDFWAPQGFGERLVILMRRRGVSSRALSTRVRALGLPCDPSVVSKWINQRRKAKTDRPERPSLAQLVAIAHVLEVSLAQLGANAETYPEIPLLEDLGLILDALPNPPTSPGDGTAPSNENIEPRRRGRHLQLVKGLLGPPARISALNPTNVVRVGAPLYGREPWAPPTNPHPR
jgi:transcriptional regulator with XRE-family HTH domain